MRILPSHPDFVEINWLSTLLCMAKNPATVFGFENEPVDNLDLAVCISDLTDALEQLMNDSMVGSPASEKVYKMFGNNYSSLLPWPNEELGLVKE